MGVAQPAERRDALQRERGHGISVPVTPAVLSGSLVKAEPGTALKHLTKVWHFFTHP